MVKVGSFAPVFEMIEKIYLWDIIDRTVDGKVTKFWIILSLRISEFFLEDLFLFLFFSLSLFHEMDAFNSIISYFRSLVIAGDE